MLPTSHSEPIFASPDVQASPADATAERGALADAFSEFIAVSGRLESSYRDLQGEVAQLNRELAERNAALGQSLDENHNMRHFLEQVLDSMPCGVIVVSAAECIEKINPEASRLLGIGADEALSLAELSMRVGVEFGACRAIEAEQQFLLPGAATPSWVEMRTRKLGGAGPASHAGRTIFILRDVTTQKEAEQDREAARRAMALAEIAATLAHEIRNPLASLELFGSLLADRSAPERTAEWVGHVRAGIRVLSGTVNNVLSFYGTGFPGLVGLPISATVAQAVEFVRPIAMQAEVQLVFTGLAHEATVYGSESALSQVVLNLVCNAVRHSAAGSRVLVTVETSRRGWVAMQCSDNGCGIPQEHLAQIFDPGFSGSGTRSGLGLAVCRRIAAEHGGALTVSSRVGCGTTFVMAIPMMETTSVALSGMELATMGAPSI